MYNDPQHDFKFPSQEEAWESEYLDFLVDLADQELGCTDPQFQFCTTVRDLNLAETAQ